jgi:hypothetical protein
MSAIVGVHGAFHEMWGPNQLLGRWQPALEDGVVLAGGLLPRDAVAIAFFGDVFRHEPGDGALDDAALRDLAQSSGLADLAQHALGPDAASVLAKMLGEDMLRRTVDQVGHYFGDTAVRAELQARVAGAIGADTRVVVAHSLGSIVAYDCMRAHPEWTIDTLVTLGSPLGNATLVLSKLERDPSWPGNIRRWVNITAPTDQVCAGTQLAPIYDARIEDVVVDNGHRGHDPEPYLCARVTGAALRHALGC